MIINRNNYETYFLLYIDNELSVEEQDMVDAFLAANPDLQKEMQSWQQAVVQPEKIVFGNKPNLLKPEPLDAEMEEQLLSLLDDELPASQKEYIESLCEYDEQVRKEWKLLQQTKLSPDDVVVFSDKSSLYRKEKSRVIPLGWWKVAAAAMLIGAGSWGMLGYFKKSVQPLHPSQTIARDSAVQQDKMQGAVAKTVVPPAQEETILKKQVVAFVNNQNIKKQNAPEKILTVDKRDKLSQPQQNNNIARQQKTDDVHGQAFQNINHPAGNNNDMVIVHKDTANESKAGNNINNITVPDTYAVNTLFQDEEHSKKDVSGYDEEDEDDRPKKTRMGGFFKKIKRIVERTTKVNTGSGNNIKIANMSFAMQ